MATQKLDCSNFEAYINENSNRLQKIEELILQLENNFKEIESKTLWTGKNADKFYDAVNTFLKVGLTKNVHDDIVNLNAYLTDALNSSIETDENVSNSMEV